MTTAKAARIVLSDGDFERFVAGESIVFDLRPDTEKIIFTLQPHSKYMKSYHDIVSDIQHHLNLPATKRI